MTVTILIMLDVKMIVQEVYLGLLVLEDQSVQTISV